MSDLVKTNNEATLSTPLLLLFHYLKSIYITLILYANRVNPTVCLFVCMCICVSRFARSAIKLRANFWRFKGIDQIIKNLSLAYVFCANGEIEGRKPFVFPFLEFSFRIDTSFAACTMSLYAESQSDWIDRVCMSFIAHLFILLTSFYVPRFSLTHSFHAIVRTLYSHLFANRSAG